MNRSGQGLFWKAVDESVHGVKVDGFISGVFGYEIPVVVKKEWSHFPGRTGTTATCSSWT